ncbi:MAG: 16S rRNA (cytosine(1402)-N(4))-methyltransferase RsmH [Gammaproteobacteria bacterium]|nr:16S rRNA (cytosine(1402)-N(4))-methyltransferase RsmH [Gammaproteobacteria bacterium]
MVGRSFSLHTSVLLKEAVEALIIKPNGIYIDGTFGRGGHSAAILSQLSEQGRLIVIDKDPQAISYAESTYGKDPRVSIVHRGFGELKAIADDLNISGQVDGILLDLGVSSPQLDEAARGFSFMRDGPLDMRMDTSRGQSVAEFLAHAEEKELANIIWRYGEEKFSRKIAYAIVSTRELQPLTTTLELAKLIEKSIPKVDKFKHPATRSFQALRIYINRELEELEQALAVSHSVLKSSGRLVVISFHSLEDRIVKQFMQAQIIPPSLPRGLPLRQSEINSLQKMRWCIKMQRADENEIAQNVRSRSAILRVAEKL